MKDVFTIGTVKVKEEDVTKRNILKTVASIFDPVVFATPFLVTGRILLQELWRLKVESNDRITKSQCKQWQEWKEGLVNLKGVTFPRCYHPSGYLAKDIQLHVFCDASKLAYGAVAYLKFEFELEKPHCFFVLSKSRLAPIKTTSLPRLALNTAVLGIRLYTTIIKEINLPIQNVLFWTDSTLVLQYLINQRHRFKVYVTNRVTEILKMTTPSQWHQIGSKEYPANICSRRVATVHELSNEIGSLKSWYKELNFL